MVDRFNSSYTVKRGDCAWNVAANNLRSHSKPVKNADIIKEMQRLARLNNCESIDDFSQKFFMSTGKEIKLDSNNKPLAQRKQQPAQQPVSKPQQAAAKSPQQPAAKQKPTTAKPAQNPTAASKTAQSPAARPQPAAPKPAPQQKVEATKLKGVSNPFDSTRLAQDSASYDTTTQRSDAIRTQNPSQPPQNADQRTLKGNTMLENLRFSAEINGIRDDRQKIITYNKKRGNKNYVIIDKKSCIATVYDKNGKALKSYEVLLGQTKGDNMSTAFAADARLRTYTTVPGEYKLSRSGSEFGGIYYMGSDGSTFDPDVQKRKDKPGSGGTQKLGATYQAMHGTANPAVRDKYYNNGSLSDNRQSMGCVNIPVESLNEMRDRYGIGIGSNIYILPEEAGNSLKYDFQNDKFVTNYADPAQNDKRERAQNPSRKSNNGQSQKLS